MNTLLESPLQVQRGNDSTITDADVVRWIRLALARNPFYILSALLLLYGIRLLSGDSRMFASETPQMLFNFSSFQFYELLLAATAIMLGRRMIWYDSGLLVGVESMFVFVPFILVSQALLLSNGMAFGLCLTGCLLAAGRLMGLKRLLPRANVPAMLLVVCGLLLCLNVALPILTRLLHEHATLSVWDQRGAYLKNAEWTWLMPALIGLAVLLPSVPVSGSGTREAFYTRRCFPLLAYVLWVAGTGVHLYCVGYVYWLPWTNGLMVPAIWAFAWVLWRRRSDLDFVPEKFGRAVAIVLQTGPAVVLLAAVLAGWGSFVWLAVATAVIYGGIAFAKREALPLHLAFVSLAVALSGLPHTVSVPQTLGFISGEWMVGVIGSYLVVWTLFSRRPGMGLVGGVILSALVWGLIPDKVLNKNFAVDLGFVFALLHSLRWESGVTERQTLAVIWVGQCLVWMLTYPLSGASGTFASGLAALAVYICARPVLGVWGARAIPCSAALVMAMAPTRMGIVVCDRAPTGLLIVVCSFVLFGIGTLTAMTKDRWLTRRSAIEVAKEVTN